MAKKTKSASYEEKAEEILLPIAEESGVRIYDVEYVKEGQDYFLRCYIDKDGGVNIGDCEAVSRALSDELDRLDFIPDAYTLEVSSPGLGRQLTKDRHLAQSIGQEVEISTYQKLPATGRKGADGVLLAFDQDTVTIGTGDGGEAADEQADTEEKIVISRKEISVIRLALDF